MAIQEETNKFNPLRRIQNEVIHLYEKYKTLTYSDLDYLYAAGRDKEEIKYEELLLLGRKVIL